MNRLFIIISLASTLLAGCSSNTNSTKDPKTSSNTESTVPNINYTVVSRLPHDTSSFTEGLLFNDGQLLESTGAPQNLPETRSTIGIIDTATGKLNVKAEINRNIYFGEGIVVFKNKLYQLTYQNQLGFIYDSKTFKQTGKFSYQNKEGWALTTDSTYLIMSDGTNKLTFLNPENLQPVKTLNVTKDGYAMDYLNELEYINGYIYANVWRENYIVKIDPKTGNVVSILDLSLLAAEAKSQNPQADVLNGIAYNPATNKVYVTGKMWKNIYEIDFPR